MAGALLVLGLHVGIASALAPTVSTPTATAVTENTATLKGTVNPGGIEGTKWRFAWGTANCAIKPNPCKFTTKGTLALGSSPVAVEKAITGLTPGTIYHFLLEAENEDGTVISADRIFATLSAPSTGLPDNRAYEQASPTDKNGEDAEGQLGLTKATASGDGITFSLSKAIVTAQGAKKGLFQNSTNICKGTHRAALKLTAQSGKASESRPKLAVKCKGKKKGA